MSAKPEKTQKLAMIVDAAKCIDCKGCMVACKVANQVPDGFWRNWIKASEPDFSQGGQGKQGARQEYQPGGCMHCDKPTCVAACPTGATYKDRADGMVKIDRALCIGCGSCIPACPYGARYRHPELRVADKCNYCPERRAAGLLPACVDTCPTKARVFGDINDPDSDASRLLAANKDRVVRVINPASDTQPNMYYLGTTKPADWPREARIPAPVESLTGVAGPLLKALVGLTGLGVIGLAAKQFLAPTPPEDHTAGHGKED